MRLFTSSTGAALPRGWRMCSALANEPESANPRVLQRDVLFVDKARADKPVLFGSLELLELCPQGAEGSGGEH